MAKSDEDAIALTEDDDAALDKIPETERFGGASEDDAGELEPYRGPNWRATGVPKARTPTAFIDT